MTNLGSDASGTEAVFSSKQNLLVGVDGSESSKRALHWAAKEANLRNASLIILVSWSTPNLGYGGYLTAIEELEREAQSSLDQATKAVSAEFPALVIEGRVVEGNAAIRLIEAADEVDLVIVGSRGHGGFASLMLGSVSGQLAHHCPKPLAIIH